MKQLLIAGTLLLLCESAFAAQARVTVTCGATLSGNKTFTLTADLDCNPAETGTRIIVRDRAHLNLDGHKIISPILLDGSRAQLTNGTVNCANTFVCVTLAGTGRHLLQNVRVERSDEDLIVVTSDNNTLIANTAFNSPEIGFLIRGSNNILQGNIGIFAGELGFAISGDSNHITQNSSVGAFSSTNVSIGGNNNIFAQNTLSGGSPDIQVSGNGHRISRNAVISPEGGSIVITGQNNVIEENFVLGGEIMDSNANCDSNIWRDNIFSTANQACIQ